MYFREMVLPVLEHGRDAVAIMGAAGATVHLLLYEGLTWRVTVATMIIGIALASAGTELIEMMLGLDMGARAVIAFLLGVVGLNIVKGVLKGTKNWADNPSIPKFWWRK